MAVLIRYGWFVLLCGLIGAGSAYAASKRQAPVYRATTLLIVDQHSGRGDSYTDLLASNQLLQTYLNLIKTAPVLDRATGRVGGISSAQLNANLHVSNPGISTQIIQMQVDDARPVRAATLANAVADSLIAVQRSVSNGNTIRVFQRAVPPTKPDHPNPRLYGVIGGLAGLLLAAGLALLLEFLDDRVRTPLDVERATGLVPLATLHPQRRKRVLLNASDNSELAEGFGILRTNMGFATLDRPLSTIVVTSAMPGEGKTTVAINLAMSLAMGSRRVLLIDADLRRPSVHERLSLPNDCGLTMCLLEMDQDLGEKLRYVTVAGLPNLLVLTAGRLPPAPIEMLSSVSMQRLLKSVLPGKDGAGLVDVVVIDTPPASSSADAAVLAALASATLLVVDAKKCREVHLLRAVGALHRVNAQIVGFVMNQVRRTGEETYFYGYGGEASLSHHAVADHAPLHVDVKDNHGRTSARFSTGSPSREDDQDELNVNP